MRLLSSDTALAVKTVAVSAIGAAATWDMPFRIIGVAPAALFCAALGAAAGLFFQQLPLPRSRVYVLFLVFTLFGAFGVAFFAHVPGLNWLDEAQPAAAFMVAALMNVLLPALYRIAPRLLEKKLEVDK
jgi:hypothetical protein